MQNYMGGEPELDIASTIRRGLLNMGTDSGASKVQPQMPREKPPSAIDNLLNMAKPMSPKERSIAEHGKGGHMMRRIGGWLTGNDYAFTGEDDHRDQYKIDKARYDTVGQIKGNMPAFREYDAMLRDDDPNNDSEALYMMNKTFGADDKLMKQMYGEHAGRNPDATGRNSEFYAGDLIYDPETNKYGQIQLDKNGGESKTKWYAENEIPKEALLSRESFDSAYNANLQSRSDARSSLGQTKRAIAKISDISEEDWSAGIGGDIETFWKTRITGDTDPEQWAKKAAINVRNLQQMQLLPPGPATDRDVQIVMDGAPADNAPQDEWVEYLTAAQNLNEKAVYYQNAKLQYMDQQGLRGMQGFNKQWEIDSPYEKYDPISPQGRGAGSALEQASEQELSEFEEWKRKRQAQGMQ